MSKTWNEKTCRATSTYLMHQSYWRWMSDEEWNVTTFMDYISGYWGPAVQVRSSSTYSCHLSHYTERRLVTLILRDAQALRQRLPTSAFNVGQKTPAPRLCTETCPAPPHLLLNLQNFSDLGTRGTPNVQCFMKRLSSKDQAEVRRGSREINTNRSVSVQGQRFEERTTGIR